MAHGKSERTTTWCSGLMRYKEPSDPPTSASFQFRIPYIVPCHLKVIPNVWSACKLVEHGQDSVGLLVMTGLLSHARPRELLRMRQCDLVPPLRGALQNFSVILAAEETGRPTKVRTFNDTLELDGPLARKLVPFWKALRGQGSKKPLWPFTSPISCRFFQKAITDLTLPPIVPFQWRHSGTHCGFLQFSLRFFSRRLLGDSLISIVEHEFEMRLNSGQRDAL